MESKKREDRKLSVDIHTPPCRDADASSVSSSIHMRLDYTEMEDYHLTELEAPRNFHAVCRGWIAPLDYRKRACSEVGLRIQKSDDYKVINYGHAYAMYIRAVGAGVMDRYEDVMLFNRDMTGNKYWIRNCLRPRVDSALWYMSIH